MKKGFTLVELVIVIVIVGILSIVAIPIYRGYVERARMTEGKVLVGAIRTAQSVYYAEYGEYYTIPGRVSYEPVLGIDARANKYYPTFASSVSSNNNTWCAVADTAQGTIGLYWAIDGSIPTFIEGHKVPVYYSDIDGVRKYYTS